MPGCKATDSTAQDYWLEHLEDAGRFNDWVLSTFVDRLGASVLEVGCGTGNFTVRMAATGRRIAAVDINPDYVAIAERRLRDFPGARVWCGDATRDEWPEPFDSVVLLDVLEHVADDGAFLRHLARALKPGGNLILKVPAGRWLYGRMDAAIGHHRRYGKASLAATLQAAGFQPVRQIYFNMAATFGWWLNGRVLGRETPPQAQLDLFERIVPLLRGAELLVSPPFGLSLVSVATYRSPA